MNFAREIQIKAQCGPRKKIVAHPCVSASSYDELKVYNFVIISQL